MLDFAIPGILPASLMRQLLGFPFSSTSGLWSMKKYLSLLGTLQFSLVSAAQW